MRARSFGPFLCLLCACYESVPVEVGRAEPGTKLRVSMTDAGGDSLARYLGPGVTSVDGKLLQQTDTNLSLSVSQISMKSGQDQFWKGESVNIPKYAVSGVLKRQVNKPRSFLLAGAIVVALATLRLSGVGGGNNGGSSGTGGGGGRQ